MALDENAAKKYLDTIDKIEFSLEHNQEELFSSESWNSFKSWSSKLRRDIEESKAKKRTLKIGIVGAVKAGKSSFLNALLFDGEERLPKAATPMTAALTKISYSDSPKANIYYYTQEDWNDITKMAKDYDKEVEKAYEDYCERIKKKSKKESDSKEKKKTPQLSLEEFGIKFRGNSESNRSAKELVVKAADDPELMDKLGKPDTISGDDLFEKLSDYIGAEGHYTPIVNYIELQIDDHDVEDLVIVDTPGLNDAVVSRGQKTKEYLRDCDVVILLSPCTEFMDADSFSLITQRLPTDGVEKILVVGSQLDSGILDVSGTRDFLKAWKGSEAKYKNTFDKRITAAKSLGNHLDILEEMEKQELLFISSVSFNIKRKLEKQLPFDDLEQRVRDNMHARFYNFEDRFFDSMSGIGNTRKALNTIFNQKKELFDNKDASSVKTAKQNHLSILEKINGELCTRKKTLGETDAEELRQRQESIKDAIGSSRTKIRNRFELAITQCEAKIAQIQPELTLEIGHHQKIDVETSTREEHYTAKAGLFGWRKIPMKDLITENTASTSTVISNIKNYAAECTKYVNQEFRLMFNKEEFSHKIKDIVINAFNQGGKQFDEDDILQPLQTVLNRISIPQISLDYKPYIDELSVRFRKDYAQDEEIHQLANLQARLLNKIETELLGQLNETLESITGTLKEQAAGFADQIENAFCEELKALEHQAKEKEHYIKKYEQYIEEVRKMKADIQNL